MTEQDRANTPAKDEQFRAWHPKTRDVIMLQMPELIQYHPGYILQKKDDNDQWAAYKPAPAEDAHPEDVEDQT